MTIRHLRIFAAVCEEGSVTKASQRLFMAQPTVSFAISELEKYYGLKLFDRISRRLYLTDAGHRLLPYARHLVSMFDEMESGMRDWENSGTLRVGASITIGNCLLPELLKSFAAEKPGINVKVQVNDSEKIENSVLENRIDFGLIEGISHNSLLVSEEFWDDELVLLFAPGHRWEAQSAVKPDDLKDEPFLMRELGSGGREIVESALLLHGIEIKPAWESISTQAIVQAVAEGFGVAVLPLLMLASPLSLGKICTKPIEGISLKRKFTIIYHKNKYLSESIRFFFELCRSQCRLN